MLTRSEFLDFTRYQMGHMRERFAPKYRDGRLVRPGRQIPFDLKQLRAWAWSNLENQKHCCIHCGKELRRDTVTLDHIVSVKRGGGLSLDNLSIPCRRCNSIKGELSLKAFKALMRGLESFPKLDRSDIVKRLIAGAMGLRMRHFPREKKPVNPQPQPKPEVKSQQQQLLEEEF
jgi:5-methylcytosine-specific restriction endonuclease McrA